MREILFRGKPLGLLDEKGFVYGSLGVIDSDLMAIYHCHEYTEDDVVLVDVGTVGQYTGLTDKNGKKIFEGDIIAWGIIPCEVKCDKEEARFCLYKYGITKIAGFNQETMNLREVVGNVIDNPELMKGAGQ